MNKKLIMKEFINVIYDKGFMTKFIKSVFNYDEINDYNYIFRMIDNDNKVIVDIYDNVSITKFNRYIFDYNDCNYIVKEAIEDDVFVKYISVLNTSDSDDNLLKFVYLFNIDKIRMLEYANTFLDDEIVDILSLIIK